MFDLNEWTRAKALKQHSFCSCLTNNNCSLRKARKVSLNFRAYCSEQSMLVKQHQSKLCLTVGSLLALGWTLQLISERKSSTERFFAELFCRHKKVPIIIKFNIIHIKWKELMKNISSFLIFIAILVLNSFKYQCCVMSTKPKRIW